MQTDWFNKKIADSKFKTQRQVALRMTNRLGRTMDQASLARMLSGERDMSLHEAVQLSELLEVPLKEIVRRALGIVMH